MMFFESLYSPGLAHMSYLLGASGQAAVIDPRRDCRVYVEIAHRHGAALTHIFETHRNEDYVTGSVPLGCSGSASRCAKATPSRLAPCGSASWRPPATRRRASPSPWRT